MAGQIVNQAQTATPGTPVTVLHVNTTSQATTGTSEEVLATYTLPANTLSADGKALRIQAWCTTAANTNSKTFQIRVGGIGGVSVASTATATSGAALALTSTVIRTGASTQVATGSGLNYTTPNRNTAATIDIVVLGTTGTAAGDLTFRALLVEALN